MRQVPFDRNSDGDIRLKVGRFARYLYVGNTPSDDVYVWETPLSYLVLSVNLDTEQVMLSAFSKKTVANAGSGFVVEPYREDFLHGQSLVDAAGKHPLGLSAPTLCRRLLEYLF